MQPMKENDSKKSNKVSKETPANLCDILRYSFLSIYIIYLKCSAAGFCYNIFISN